MAFFTDVTYLAPVGSTGNLDGTLPAQQKQVPPQCVTTAFQFVIEAVGSTPTVTFKYQGSLDGTNWFDVLYTTDASDTAATTAITKTGTGAFVVFLNGNSFDRFYKYFRVVTSANTNVTYRAEMYCHATD